MPKSTKKTKPAATSIIKTKETRPPIIAERIYNRAEAALAAGVSYITIIRAKEKGELGFYKKGRRVLHSGAHLLAWLKADEFLPKGAEANA